jgi:A/G-specific adenine glycosylase
MTAADVAARLLAWYDRHRRVLPWRSGPGIRPDPYRVWLSEVMLQQTTVAAALPHFQRFVDRWPTVDDLARAPAEEILSAWAGLGYYARARNLHACARTVSRELGGRFPDSEAALLRLPGIGRYTAAAIAAIAFERPATVVDGNVERVVSRLFAVPEPLPAVRPRLYDLAAGLSPALRPGDYAQAMMDLGATVCTPRSPGCAGCPLAEGCLAHRQGLAADLPRRAARVEKPVRRGVVFWLTDGAGAVLLERRPARGLLGGMAGLPGTDWAAGGGQAGDWPGAAALAAAAPVQAEWRLLPGLVTQTFTHFKLELKVAAAETGGGPRGAAGGPRFWQPVAGLAAAGLPTVMRKAVQLALASDQSRAVSAKSQPRRSQSPSKSAAKAAPRGR